MRLKEVAEYVRTGNKIQAIKVYREIFGVGLKEAKDAVEAMETGQPVVMTRSHRQVQVNKVQVSDLKTYSSSVTAAPSQGRRSGCLLFSFILVLLLIVGGALLVFLPIVTSATSLIPPQLLGTEPSPTPGLVSLVSTFGQEGLNPGQFTDARHVAVDGAGIIYVAEWKEGSRVQRFDPNGKFLSQWTVADPKAIVTGLAADRQGTVYVIQGSSLSRYRGETGELLRPVTYEEETSGFEAVTSVPDGGVMAFWSGNFTQEAIRLDPEGKVTGTIPEVIIGQTDKTESDPHLAVDGQDNLYVLGGFAEAVFKYGPDGRFINQFGSSGNEPGQFQAVQAIAVDGRGRVYIGDSSSILVFGPDGRYLDMIETEGTPFGLAFTPQDELLVASRTQVFRYVMRKEP
jgi:sugar lactone lactonase YvrE